MSVVDDIYFGKSAIVSTCISFLPKVPDTTPPTAELKQTKGKNDKGKPSRTKVKKVKKESKKKASFGHSKQHGKLKAAKVAPSSVEARVGSDPVDDGVPVSMYKGYDISMLPLQARPDLSKPNRGEHSYTLRNPANDATIEVLLKHAAYFIKKVSPRGSGRIGQISMKVHGPQGGWDLAKERAGFDS